MTGLFCRTARSLLRAVRADDLGPLYALATAPEAARMLFLFHPGMARDDFARLFPLDTVTPPFRAVIEVGGRVAGSIGVGPGAEPPIYYFLSPDCTGRGLATEIVGAFCAEIERRHAPRALTAEVFTDNPASLKVLQRNGFRITGEAMIRSAGRDAPAPALTLGRG